MTGAPVRPTEAEAASRLALAGLLRNSGGVIECVVRGCSMVPTLPPGSMVRIDPPSETAPSKGEVVAMAVRDQIITHRVVREDHGSGHLLTRGDGCLLPDPPVAVEWVLGRVREARVNGEWEPVAAPPGGPALHAAARGLFEGLLTLLLSFSLPLADRVAHLLVRASRSLGRHREGGAERLT